jgi:tetratricopeptide (TPR) repeat protein
MTRIGALQGLLAWGCVGAMAAFLGCARPVAQLPQEPEEVRSVLPAPLGEAARTPAQLLEQARRALAERDYREAARAAREAGRSASEADASRLLEAEALQAMGDLAGALSLWREAVAAGPDDPKVWAAYAELAARRGAGTDALAVFLSRLNRLPDGESIPPELSGITGWTALAAGLPERAAAYLAKTLDTPEAARFALALGHARLQIGDLDGAVSAAENGLAGDVGSVDAWLLLGDARRAKGLAAGAREAYLAVLDRDADNYAARINLGVLSLQRGEAEAAITLLETAAETRPGAPEAWHNLGLARRFLGQWARAKEAYETALRVAPGYPPALKNLGILNEKYLGLPGSAVPYYDRYLEQVPGDEEVRRWRKTAERLAAEAEG